MKYTVKMTRTYMREGSIEVEAGSPEEAHKIALDKSEEIEFTLDRGETGELDHAHSVKDEAGKEWYSTYGAEPGDIYPAQSLTQYHSSRRY